MNNITIEGIGWDGDLFLLKVTAQAKSAWAKTEVYVSDISDLANMFLSYPDPKGSDFYWAISETAKVERDLSFKIIPKDKLGHLMVEVYMTIKDHKTSENHHAVFCVQTEIGMLNSFGKRLEAINKPIESVKVSLAETEQ